MVTQMVISNGSVKKIRGDAEKPLAQMVHESLGMAWYGYAQVCRFAIS